MAPAGALTRSMEGDDQPLPNAPPGHPDTKAMVSTDNGDALLLRGGASPPAANGDRRPRKEKDRAGQPRSAKSTTKEADKGAAPLIGRLSHGLARLSLEEPSCSP